MIRAHCYALLRVTGNLDDLDEVHVCHVNPICVRAEVGPTSHLHAGTTFASTGTTPKRRTRSMLPALEQQHWNEVTADFENRSFENEFAQIMNRALNTPHRRRCSGCQQTPTWQ